MALLNHHALFQVLERLSCAIIIFYAVYGCICSLESYLFIDDVKHYYNNNNNNDDARLAMKIRLNMIETIGSNFGMRTECLLCGSLDSTEHVLSCEKMERRSSRAGIEELGKGERMGEIVKQFQEMERERTIEMKTKTEREINDMCDVSVNMNGYAAANGLDVENEPGDEMIL